MIRYIKGIYSMTFENSIIVETSSGIGFEIFLPVGSPLYRYGEGEEIMVYTSMAVKEDDISLYGFHNREALELFELLITVSGIGAKGAMSILSTLQPTELKRAILFEDAKEISRANGVGKKTAERLILELKDKIGKMSGAVNDGYGPADLREPNSRTTLPSAARQMRYCLHRMTGQKLSMRWWHWDIPRQRPSVQSLR